MSSYSVVIGGLNIDIFGKSLSPLLPADSNIGTVSTSPGGVGHNIAANMSLLGMKVGMITALGDDHLASLAENDCQALGIDLSHAVRVPGGATGCYLAIAGPDGDMALALNDMTINEAITPEVVFSHRDWLCGADLVVFDGNPREDTMAAIAACCTAPIFCDPVSVAKCGKVRPLLDRIHTFKPNLMEAQALTGAKNAGDAARALVDLGVKNAFVSAGSDGIYACNEKGERAHAPILPSRLRNATGGGDAVMAALCRAYGDGLSLGDACRFAMAAGSIAVESEATISPLMSLETVRKKLTLN